MPWIRRNDIRDDDYEDEDDPPRRHTSLGVLLAAGALLFIAVLGVALAAGNGDDDDSVDLSAPLAFPTVRATSPPVVLQPELELVSSSCAITSSAFIECEGFVKNVSPKPLRNVMVVIILADSSGTLLSSDDALIDYNPILAGQTSPWSVYVRYNPAFAKFGVQFKELAGGTIRHRDVE